MSAWSLNRDSECGGAFPRIGVVSNTCSGVLQTPLEFTHIFGGCEGTKMARNQTPESVAAAAATATGLGRRSGGEPVPDLALDGGVRHRLQGRLAATDLPGELVEPGDSPDAAEPAPRAGRGSRSAQCPPEATRRSRSLLASGTFQAWSPTRGLPSGRQGQLRRAAVPGALVHAGRAAPRRSARRSGHALGAALQVPGRTDGREHRNEGEMIILAA